MHRNHRNQGGRQGQRPTRHTRNNPVYEDLFASSVAPSETSSDSLPAIATPGRGEPIDAPLPAEIVRRRLSDYARPVIQRQTTRVNAPYDEVRILKLTHIFLAFCPLFMDYHRRIRIDMWTSSARCANSTNSTMSPPRLPRCASSLSRLRKGRRSGSSAWAASLIHGERWKTHFCVSTTR